jgi:hypothetical protein
MAWNFKPKPQTKQGFKKTRKELKTLLPNGWTSKKKLIKHFRWRVLSTHQKKLIIVVM